MPPKEALVHPRSWVRIIFTALWWAPLNKVPWASVPVGIPPDVWGEGSSEGDVPCRVWNQPIFVPIILLKKTINSRVWGWAQYLSFIHVWKYGCNNSIYTTASNINIKIKQFFFFSTTSGWNGKETLMPLDKDKSAAITDGKCKGSLEKQDSSEMNYYLWFYLSTVHWIIHPNKEQQCLELVKIQFFFSPYNSNFSS